VIFISIIFQYSQFVPYVKYIFRPNRLNQMVQLVDSCRPEYVFYTVFSALKLKLQHFYWGIPIEFLEKKFEKKKLFLERICIHVALQISVALYGVLTRFYPLLELMWLNNFFLTRFRSHFLYIFFEGTFGKTLLKSWTSNNFFYSTVNRDVRVAMCIATCM